MPIGLPGPGLIRRLPQVLLDRDLEIEVHPLVAEGFSQGRALDDRQHGGRQTDEPDGNAALPQPAPHPNTVATIIKILIEKGYVGFEQQGRNNLYKIKVNREEYAKRSFTKLMKTYFGGSPSNIVSHLVNEHKMSIKELEGLLKHIKSSKK